ncbi:Transmembrane_domain-containing protein [Hexamita inflata]|uniref:Transmembrane domain-containing protein n=1 Tax=Hexamita inflata TaxID=28002 RepID=A0AA86U9C5_9EUKA|nr:Transmembrane domain-containing protein [Hexamita inflata]
MPTNTEQTYELAFTSTLIFNVVFSFVVFAIFPFLRKLLPGVFAPQKHMYKKPTTRRNYYFWFIDVFSQPISVYSTRGNLTTIYIIFQYLILMLYGIMALISITILIPVYYYGTDTSWKTHYLTNWSRLSIGHLEKDSVMHIVPIIIICIFTYFAMFVYEQFTIIYAFFRQKCMKRVIPENYVVLLQNLPVDVDTKEKLENILLNIKNGIRYIVPIPKQSGKLTKILKQLQSLFDQLKQGQQMMEDFNANQAYRSAVVKLIPQHQKVKKALKQKKADKLKKKEYKQIQKVSNVMFKIRSCYQEILKIKAVDNIEIEHLKQILSIPPPLPEMLVNAFDLLPDSTQMIPQIRYPSNKYLHNIQQNHQDYQQQNIMLEHTEQPQHHIGHAAFIICQSQAIAAEKYTTLIAQNSQKPKAMLASNSKEITWENVATNDKKRKWSYCQYIFQRSSTERLGVEMNFNNLNVIYVIQEDF